MCSSVQTICQLILNHSFPLTQFDTFLHSKFRNLFISAEIWWFRVGGKVEGLRLLVSCISYIPCCLSSLHLIVQRQTYNVSLQIGVGYSPSTYKTISSSFPLYKEKLTMFHSTLDINLCKVSS